MTAALVGVCHVLTALGRAATDPVGRSILACGGFATMAVAVIPLDGAGQSRLGTPSSPPWRSSRSRPGRRSPGGGATVPFTVRPRIGVGVAAVLLGLVGRTGAELALDGPAIGLWEAGGGRCRLRLATGVHSRGAYCPPFEWCRPPPTVARSSWAASAGRGGVGGGGGWRRGHDLGLLDRSAVRLRRRERIRPRVRSAYGGCEAPAMCS